MIYYVCKYTPIELFRGFGEECSVLEETLSWPILMCRGEHWSPVAVCGKRKVPGRIWNPPLRRMGRRPR